jgi:hypothetical protein
MRDVLPSNPGPGADIVVTVPANARWRPTAFQYAFVTSATVANRTSSLIITDGVNVVFENTQSPVQAASATVVYNWSTLTNITAVVLNQLLNTFPPLIFLEPGWTIATTTNNIQVGDQYSGIHLAVEEWIET